MWRGNRGFERLRVTRAGAALAGGLALVVAAIALTLAGHPLVVGETNAIPANEPLLETKSATGICQDGETLPAHVSAVRLTLVSDIGPRVSVEVLSAGRVLTRGVAGSGWTSGAVTVPVRPLARAVSHARLCFQSGPTVESVTVGGLKTSAALAAHEPGGGALPGRFTVEYMRAGTSSWWSLAHAVARRLGLGRAPAGTWVALALLAAMAAAVASAAWLAVRELR